MPAFRLGSRFLALAAGVRAFARSRAICSKMFSRLTRLVPELVQMALNRFCCWVDALRVGSVLFRTPKTTEMLVSSRVSIPPLIVSP